MDDIINKNFGDWLVLSYSHKQKRGHYYKCQCSCSRTYLVRRDSLLQGRTVRCQSCAITLGKALTRIKSSTRPNTRPNTRNWMDRGPAFAFALLIEGLAKPKAGPYNAPHQGKLGDAMY
jgi:PHP family Zn ribbon phosphoesterase